MKSIPKIGVYKPEPDLASAEERTSVAGDAAREAARWAFINEWHVESQGDDRRQVSGSVPESTGSSAARRASARQSHQVNFKAWSKERHD